MRSLVLALGALLACAPALSGQSLISLGVDAELLGRADGWNLATQSDEVHLGQQQVYVRAISWASVPFLELGVGAEAQVGTTTLSGHYAVSGYGSVNFMPGEVDSRQINAIAKALLKVPFTFTTAWPLKKAKLTVYPLAGVEVVYPLVVAADYLNGFLEYLDALVDLGIGVEVPLGPLWFVRGQLTYGLNLTPGSSAMESSALSTGRTYQSSGGRFTVSMGLAWRI